MADIEKTLKLGIDTGDAVQSVKKLRDGINDLSEEVDKVGDGDNLKNFNTQLDNQKKALDKVEQSAKKTGGGISSMVGKIAAGISIAGLANKAFELFTDALMKNQKVADFVSTAMKTIEIILSQVVNVIVSVIEKVGETNDGFTALGKVVSGLITLSLTPLKLAFFGIKLVIEELQLAWEESFFGDGDPETIKKLTESIEGTKKSLTEVGEDALKAGKDVVTNFVPAVVSVGQVVEGVVEGVSKIDVKAAITTAKNITSLQNTARLAQEEAKRLAEQFDRQAEKLRQIRDNDLLSIEERKKANEDLALVLDKQESALIAQADAGVALAQANLQVNNTVENRAALTAALTEKDAALAKVEGLRSEQQQNRVNLTKEEIQLNQTAKAGEIERAKLQQDFLNSQIKNEVQRLEDKKRSLEEEKQAELDLLEQKRLTFALGTQARVDADNEYLNKKQEFDNKILQTEAELALKIKENDNKSETARLEANILRNDQDFESKQLLLDKQREQALSNTNLTEGERLKITEEYNNKQKALEEDLNKLKVDAVKNGLSAISSLTELFAGKSKKQQEKAFKIQKAVSIAQTTIATAESAVNAYKSLAGIPVVGPVLGGIASAAAIAAGLVQIKKIKEQKFEGGGSEPSPSPAPTPVDTGGGTVEGSGGGGLIAPPRFNLRADQIGGAGTLLGSNGQSNQNQPVRVYVTESDITNTQNKVQVVQGNSLFGSGGG